MPEDFFPMIVGVVFFMIPIVAILTKHQQKMAELMRQGMPQANQADNEMLRREMDALRQLVMQQTIAIDNLAAQHKELSSKIVPAIDERIGPRA